MPLSTVLGAQSLVQPAVCTTATRPASPYTGQAIYDTTISALLVWSGTAWTGTGGLQLVTTATCSSGGTAVGGVVTIGSAVSSVTVAAAFSATYDSYKIVVSGGVGSVDAKLGLKLGASATGYYAGVNTINYTGATASNASDDNATSWTRAGRQSSVGIFLNVELVNPFLAARTTIFGQYIAISGAGAGFNSGYHNVATSYTDFTLTPDSGTLTGGTIRVYGYQNS